MKVQMMMLWAVLLISFQTPAQSKISFQTYTSVLKLADSISIDDGSLKIYNIFKIQVQTIYENQEKPEELFRAQVLEKTYVPYQKFWAGYVGDSKTYFDEIILPLLKDSMVLIESKTFLFANGKIDLFFKEMADKMQVKSGHFPKGIWYLTFGSGVTDLGGFGSGVMVLDLTHAKTTLDYTKFILPHEMNHQIFDFTNTEDTTAKGLYRCINEGFAVWINQQVLGNKFQLHSYFQYSEAELRFCLENEASIFKKLKPFLFTNQSEHALALADRGKKVFKEGPGAIGYFLGYRICEAYTRKAGSGGWKEIYTLPVKQVFEKSGYNPE